MKKLSIITINYNNKKGLQKTIDSVITQTFQDFEWIIIDGGSTDGSKELIEQYSQHITYWVSEPDKGIYHAMNKGIRVAQGEYLNFLNSGDIYYNKVVLYQFSLTKNKADFICGNTLFSNKETSFIIESPAFISSRYILFKSINHQSSFIKTSILKNKEYNENYKIVSDWEFMYKYIITSNYSYHKLNFVVANYNMDGISSINNSLLIQEKSIVIANTFDLITYKIIRGDTELEKMLFPIKPSSQVYKFITFIVKVILSINYKLHKYL